jgi:hypothetical protein
VPSRADQATPEDIAELHCAAAAWHTTLGQAAGVLDAPAKLPHDHLLRVAVAEHPRPATTLLTAFECTADPAGGHGARQLCAARVADRVRRVAVGDRGGEPVTAHGRTS